jgi:hypothetical protein
MISFFLNPMFLVQRILFVSRVFSIHQVLKTVRQSLCSKLLIPDAGSLSLSLDGGDWPYLYIRPAASCFSCN